MHRGPEPILVTPLSGTTWAQEICPRSHTKENIMLERIRKAQKNEGGFTLIELLIVIIILGILAAIVVFAVSSTRSDSVASACKTDLKSAQLSAEAVNTKTGSYPAA